MKTSECMFYGGLSGLQVDIPKYSFPPPFQNSSRLTYYASLFNSIEINSSFYKIPQAATVKKWADSVPPDFRFTFKLWKGITHIPHFDFNETDVTDFLAAINSVQDKKGCLLIQFPPGISINNIAQLDKLLACIHQFDTSEWHVSVEFRNKSWYEEDVYDLLNSYNSALVIHDKPKAYTPAIIHKSGFIYLRFHGPAGDYRQSYSTDFLEEYVTYIEEWMNENKKVFVYFNNTIGDAFSNLKTINSFIRNRAITI